MLRKVKVATKFSLNIFIFKFNFKCILNSKGFKMKLINRLKAVTDFEAERWS